MTQNEIEEILTGKYGSSFMSRQEVAQELGVSPQTIRRAEASRKLLPARLSARCVRYPVTQVAAYIAGCIEREN